MANLFHNINTLVEQSDYSIKISLDGKEYWLMGVDENHVWLLATNDQEEETTQILTETLLQVVMTAVLSQVDGIALVVVSPTKDPLLSGCVSSQSDSNFLKQATN